MFSQRLWYYGIFVFLALSGGVFLLWFFFDASSTHLVYRVYVLLALANIWYTFLLLFRLSLRSSAGGQVLRPLSCGVVIPCYNEEPALLERCLQSVRASHASCPLILVDDGSRADFSSTYRTIATSYRAQFFSLPENKGKREALVVGLRQLPPEVAVSVTFDSDTVLEKYALEELVKPFSDERVGAVTGDVRILNHTNWLTRMTETYYWVALHIHRKAQSARGMVSCCSGALAAYRRGPLDGVLEAFRTETFLGMPCTYADDRHLTNLMLKEGWDVVFQPEAISYTHVPSTLTGFLVQQVRWRRGFFQEATYALTFLWHRKRLLFFEILVWELFLPLFSIGFIFMSFLLLVVDPVLFVLIVLPGLFTVAVVRNLPLVIARPRALPSLFSYVLFSTFVMHWVTLYAVFTLRRRGWSTR